MAGDDTYFPGVQLVERIFQPGRSTDQQVSTYAAFIGRSVQGPTTPTLVTSWSDFIATYGQTYTDLHFAVNDYFANGGRLAYIQRISGTGATSGDVDVFANDAPEDPSNPGQVLPGTPPLFTVSALSPGAWGNRIFAVVYARDTTNKRFDLALYKVPSTITFDPSKRNSEYLLEQWIDLSLDPADSRYLYDIVNAPSATGSTYVQVSGQSYDPATPGTRPFPDTTGANQLSGGTDGTYASPTFDSDAAYIAGVNAMAQVPGPYILNIPNISDSDIIRAAVQAAANRGDVFVVIDPPQGKTPAEVKSFVETDLGLGSIGVAVPSYAAVYYPWLYLPAVGSAGSGKTTIRPPGGAVVGLYMASDASYGAWKAPAGLDTRVSGAVELERRLLDADLSLLNNAHVNAIRSIPGSGIVVMGARTTKKSGLDRYVNVRRSMIFLRESLRRATEYAVFRPNDNRLWTDLQSTCSRILGVFWQAGGLSGTTAAEAYYVTCDGTNNNPSSVEAGQVNIEVGVALTVPAEFIVITIGQFDGGSTVSSSL